MLSLDLARQLAADRTQALHASAGRAPGTHRRRRARPHPLRRLLAWLDRVAPAEGPPMGRRAASATGDASC